MVAAWGQPNRFSARVLVGLLVFENLPGGRGETVGSATHASSSISATTQVKTVAVQGDDERALVVSGEDVFFLDDDEFDAATPSATSATTSAGIRDLQTCEVWNHGICGSYQHGCGKGCYTTSFHSCNVCQCQPGRFATYGGVVDGQSCTECPEGQYQSIEGSTTCNVCPVVSRAVLFFIVLGWRSLLPSSPFLLARQGHFCPPGASTNYPCPGKRQNELESLQNKSIFKPFACFFFVHMAFPHL